MLVAGETGVIGVRYGGKLPQRLRWLLLQVPDGVNAEFSRWRAWLCGLKKRGNLKPFANAKAKLPLGLNWTTLQFNWTRLGSSALVWCRL